MAPLRWAKNLVLRLFGCKPGAASKDDMVRRMLRSTFAKEADFPITRVAVNAGGLLIDAIETTSQVVAQVIEYFLRRPDLLDEAKCKAALPDLGAFDSMVREALRFVPISPYMCRQASIDCADRNGTRDRHPRRHQCAADDAIGDVRCLCL